MAQTMKIEVHVPSSYTMIEVEMGDVIEHLLHNVGDIEKWNMLASIVNHLHSNAHELEDHHKATVKLWLKKKTELFNETEVSQ